MGLRKHIEDKQEFYALSRAGLLGNTLTQWTWAEFARRYNVEPKGLPEVVGVRHVRRAFTKAAVSRLMGRDEAYRYGWQLGAEAHDTLLIDEGAPNDRITIQGEITSTEYGLYLRYGYDKVHQRTLWTEATQHAFGIFASGLLQRYMDPSSWDLVNEIFQQFEYPIIEFTCFDRAVGQLKWNTLFWEVRTKY